MIDEGDRLSCGAVIARETGDGWLTLMLRAYHNWDFPKGICEEGESPMDAAIREIGDYLAKTMQESVEMGIAPELGRPEHHEYRWLNFDEAYDLSAPRVRVVVQWARQIIGT